MATEKQIHDFLVSGQSEGKTMTIKNRGLTGSRNQITYQIGRGMTPQDIVTPADQAAAQTRSEVQHSLATPGVRKGYKRKAMSRSSSQRRKSSSRSRSKSGPRKKRRKRTTKRKTKKTKEKRKSSSKKGKAKRKKKKKKGTTTRRRSTPAAKLRTKPTQFTPRDVFTRNLK